MSSPRTLVIMVNWNKAAVLDTMLSSLEASGPREYDAVLVDNASTDNSVSLVREKYPWVHILENSENLGGTGGFNRGMEYGLLHEARYDFLWLLDNDVYIHPGAYRALLQPMLEDPEIGMVGSTILLMSDPSQVQEAGVNIVWETGAFERNAGGALADVTPHALLRCDFVPACSCLVRVAAIEQVGAWDPAYFLMWDDIEWGIRFTRAGWKVVAATDALVRHESYDNRRAKSPAWISYVWLRNSLYTFRNYAPAGKRTQLFYTIFRQTLSLMDNCNASGRVSELRALRQAIADFYSNRMGKPPKQIYEQQAGVAVAAAAPPTNLHSIALLVSDNAKHARAIVKNLQHSYPNARIDCLVTNTSPQLLAEELPNRRIQPIDSLVRRMTLALRLALGYEAVAIAGNQPRFLFTRLSKYVLQFTDETNYYCIPRDIVGVLATVASRPFLWIRASMLAARAARLPPLQVNYHFWRK